MDRVRVARGYAFVELRASKPAVRMIAKNIKTSSRNFLRSGLLLCDRIKVLAKSRRNRGFTLALWLMVCPAANGQNRASEDSAVVTGSVCDSQDHALDDAIVLLENASHAKKLAAHSDQQGHYRFTAVPPGSYTVRVMKQGYAEKSVGPLIVHLPKVKIPVLHLALATAPPPVKDTLSAIQFSDEPSFTVAGVTGPSNLGGHGSDTALRTRETLARDAASLNHADAGSAGGTPHDSPNAAETHTRLAEIAETDGRPLDAVREYQRASELEPSEAHLFAWGAELLLHRAFEPAIEVFGRGHLQFPASSRLLVGLGVATYDQGATEQGLRILLEACDLHPSDAVPYLFLGKLQEAEKTELPRATEKLQRFAGIHPENAFAHYYFAVALGKRSPDSEDFAAVESELQKALQINPQFGAAYLQLGVLYSAKKNIPDAVAALKKAIETMPLPDEAHYRLAELYRQSGDTENARKEIELYREVSRRRTTDAGRSHNEIQQFVYTLREPSSAPTTPGSKPQ
jgi:tetratricopeptide (TPR) repeat protein